MNTVGYEYITRDQWPEGWEQTVAQAAGEFDQAILGEKQKLLERINTNRLQLKFARSVAALPPAICACVKELEGRMRTLCGDGVADGLMLQDCYALLTPADETDEEARSPQKWHLDAITRFPVAALVLRGGRCTEFSVGAYSDFSAGVAPATLERWTAPLKNIHARTWESDSIEEWMHFQHHLHTARLVTGTAAPQPLASADAQSLRPPAARASHFAPGTVRAGSDGSWWRVEVSESGAIQWAPCRGEGEPPQERRAPARTSRRARTRVVSQTRAYRRRMSRRWRSATGRSSRSPRRRPTRVSLAATRSSGPTRCTAGRAPRWARSGSCSSARGGPSRRAA
eukprot:Transcript_11107.p1 GENE.Transcript_11107~~Transcript_11107.p1  ORF type:complete len:341 (-),score=51.28 Transcript_11107:184-1206(-)